MKNYFPPLLPEQVYHLQSWANGNEKLYREQENYRFFLERFIKYALPVAELYSYSLVPDHFDLLVRIRNKADIEKHFILLKPGFEFDQTKISSFIMKCFSNMLNSYSKSFNKVYQRRGSLFIDYVRRLEIVSGHDLCNSVIQIHKSPVQFGHCDRMRQWTWSSFWNYISEFSGFISTEEVLNSFGGKDEFINCHKNSMKLQLDTFYSD